MSTPSTGFPRGAESTDDCVSTASGAGSRTDSTGIQTAAPVEPFPTETYDLMHDVMQRAPLGLTKHRLPHMQDNDDGRGAIGNMCSVHGHL